MEKLRMKADEITVQKDVVFSYHVHTNTYCEMTLYFPFECIKISFDESCLVNGNNPGSVTENK